MLKRKKLREIIPGDVCVLNADFVSKVKETKNYEDTSILYYLQNLGYSTVTSRLYRKKKKTKIIHFADSKLVFIIKNSIFGNNLLNVVPIVTDGDCLNQSTIMELIRSKKKFIVHKDALSLASSNQIDEYLESHKRDLLQTMIKRNMD